MNEIEDKIVKLEAKIDEILISIKKTKRNSQIFLWVTVALFILPLIGLVFAIPKFLGTYNDLLSGTGF